MSDYELKRINALPEASAINDSDVFAIDSAAGTKKVAWETLKGEVDADISEAVSNKADIDGTYPDMAVGSVLGTNTVTDREPYFLRPSASIGDREFDTLVGGSLGWNQLCNGSSVTVESGHKYYMIKGGTGSVGASDGTALTGLTSGTDIVIDLTIDFGATIADYIYSLETATAGAGVAWVKKYLPNDYYAYCAPTLKHVSGVSAHVMTGFNQFDKSTVVQGHYIDNDGSDKTYGILSHTDYIKAVPNTVYYISDNQASANVSLFACFDSGKNFIGFAPAVDGNGKLRETLPNTAYIIVNMLTSVIDTICINLHWDGEKDGQYEPYVEHSYPLDSALTLRGIPKLDASNRLYYDGDTYASDGTVTRRYGVVDLGTLDYTYESSSGRSKFTAYITGLATNGGNANAVFAGICAKYRSVSVSATWVDGDISWYGNSINAITIINNAYTDAATFKTAMSGVYLVYEKQTASTSTASPFTSPQICDKNGTEEYVTTGLVPVGHETEYVENLADKLTDIPDLPTIAGTYRLKVTVSGGVPSYSWVSE